MHKSVREAVKVALWVDLSVWLLVKNSCSRRPFDSHYISLIHSQRQQQEPIVHNMLSYEPGNRETSQQRDAIWKWGGKSAATLYQIIFKISSAAKLKKKTKEAWMKNGTSCFSGGGADDKDLRFITFDVHRNIILYAWEAMAHFPLANGSCKWKEGGQVLLAGWQCCVENVMWLVLRLAQSPSVLHRREGGSEPENGGSAWGFPFQESLGIKV